MAGGGGGGDGGAGAEAERQRKITEGMRSIDQTFGRFTPDYYGEFERKAYAQTEPDIETQYKDAVRNATYALSRGGNRRSSAGANAYADLKERYDRAKLEANDRARQAAAARRSEVESARSATVSQLNATADPYAAAQAAARQAESLTAPPAYSPVTDIFSQWTAQLADAQSRMRAGTGRGWGQQLGFGSGGSPGSVRQVA